MRRKREKELMDVAGAWLGRKRTPVLDTELSFAPGRAGPGRGRVSKMSIS